MKVHKILLEDTNTKTDTTTTDIEDIFNNTSSAEQEEKARIIRERRIKAIRVARDAREAAKKARTDGNVTMADKLDKEADQLERWANRNELSKGDQTSSNNHSKGGSGDSQDSSTTNDSNNSEGEDEETSDANRAQDAADAAKEAAEEAKDAAEKAAEKAKEAAESGQADSKDLADAAEAAKDAAEAAEEAANKAQKHADAAKDAEEAGDSEKAQAEADAAEEAAGEAEEAAEGAKEAAGDGNSDNEGEESDNDADSSSDGDSSGDESSEDDEADSDSDNEQNNGQNSNSGSNSSNSQSSAQELENPFNLEPRHAQMSAGMPGQQNQNQQDEFDNMMQILKMLRNGESAGAKAALNDILKSRKEAASKQESLHEDLIINKTIEEIDEDSFDNIINQVLDDVNTIEPISYDGPRDLRVKKIKQDLESPKSRRDFDREDAINIQGGGDKIKKDRETRREARRTNVAYMPGTEQFKDDLYDTVCDQLDKIKKEKNSWGAINKHHQNDNIIKQGKVIRGEYDEKTPLIQVYLDCSSSFNANDIKREKDLLEVIEDFEDEGEIIKDLYYFSDDIFRDYESARNQGGTRAWPKIIANIIKTAPSNVLIVTDSDMEYDAIASNKYYRVDGCVWYIWKRSRADALPKHLDGATGLKEYSIKWD